MSDYLPSFLVEPVLRQARRFSERIGGDESPSSGPIHSSVGFALPAVPDFPFQRFNPTRLWSQSPPLATPTSVTADPIDITASRGIGGVDSRHSQDEEAVVRESTLQSIARNIQLWANQINNLDDFDEILAPDPTTVSLERGIANESAGVESTKEDTEHDLPFEMTESPTLELHDIALPTAEVPGMTGIRQVDLDTQRIPQNRPLPSPRVAEPQRTNSETSLNPAHELPYRSRLLANDRRQSDPLTSPNAEQLMDLPRSSRQVDEMITQAPFEGRRDGSGALPEDDGMGPMRQKITAVWAGNGTPQEKSKLIHTLMMEKHRQSQGQSSQRHTSSATPVMPPVRAMSPISTVSAKSVDVHFNLTRDDLQPTYAPADLDEDPQTSTMLKRELGCVHYKRNVKMQCFSCEKWYTCRLCHDAIEDHILPRRDTKHMLCMLCKTPQQASQWCKSCGQEAACYYCPICKLWNNDAEKSIYHCDDCGICRLGQGLGKDFFHCKTCVACMSIQAESTHRCIERSTKCDCPICGEYMFTSNKPVAFMRCGHSIHETCFGEWCNTSYKCPICSKSIANMESQFRRLDRHIEDQPMPEEYRDNRAYVFCNDCNSRSVTKYHWLGLKCAVCDSYNTAQLELLGAESPAILAQADRAQEMGVGEAGITASQTQTPALELTSPAMSAGARTGGVPSPALSRQTSGVEVPNTLTGVTSPTSGVMIRSPPSRRDSPFHHVIPGSPNRNARAMSPVVGSYFGTSQRAASETTAPRRGSYFSVFSMGTQNEEATNIATSSSPQTQPQRPHASSVLAESAKATDLSGPSDARSISQGNEVALDDDDDDEDLDFWGGTSPRSYDANLVDLDDVDLIEEEESSSDEDELMEDGDDDEDDVDDMMDILGHR